MSINSVNVDSWKNGENNCWWNIAKNQIEQNGKTASSEEIQKLAKKLEDYNKEKNSSVVRENEILEEGDKILLTLDCAIDEINANVKLQLGAVDTKQKDLTAAQEHLGYVKSDVASTKERWEAAKNASPSNEESIQKAKASYDAALKRQEEAEKAVEEKKTALETAKEELEALKGELEALQKEYADEQEEYKDELGKIQKHITTMDTKIQSAQTELDKAKTEYDKKPDNKQDGEYDDKGFKKNENAERTQAQKDWDNIEGPSYTDKDGRRYKFGKDNGGQKRYYEPEANNAEGQNKDIQNPKNTENKNLSTSNTHKTVYSTSQNNEKPEEITDEIKEKVKDAAGAMGYEISTSTDFEVSHNNSGGYNFTYISDGRKQTIHISKDKLK